MRRDGDETVDEDHARVGWLPTRPTRANVDSSEDPLKVRKRHPKGTVVRVLRANDAPHRAILLPFVGLVAPRALPLALAPGVPQLDEHQRLAGLVLGVEALRVENRIGCVPRGGAAGLVAGKRKEGSWRKQGGQLAQEQGGQLAQEQGAERPHKDTTHHPTSPLTVSTDQSLRAHVLAVEALAATPAVAAKRCAHQRLLRCVPPEQKEEVRA